MAKRVAACLIAAFLLLSCSRLEVLAVEAASLASEDARWVRGGRMQPLVLEFPEGEGSSEEFHPSVFSRKGSQRYHSEWDQYSTNFYYNQLTEEEKAFWDLLDELALYYLTQKKDAVLYASDDPDSLYATAAVSYQGLDEGQAEDIYFLFYYSNPQYYYLLPGVYQQIEGKKLYPIVLEEFADGETRYLCTQKFKSRVEEWTALVGREPTDWQKEKAAHDLICSSVVYDHDFSREQYNQSAYSAFFSGATICAGYSHAMEILMNGVGIDCAAAVSRLHEWNLIRLNDTWYHLDLTWDDNDNDKGDPQIIYAFYNRSIAKMLQLEKDDGSTGENHQTSPILDGFLPQTTKDSGAGLESPGSVYEPQATAKEPEIFIENGSVTITAEPGASVYYTTDGKEPCVAQTKSSRYAGEFLVPSNTLIRAMASKDGCYDSVVVQKMCEQAFPPQSGDDPQDPPTGGAQDKPQNPAQGGDSDEEKKFTVRFESNKGSAVKDQKLEPGSLAAVPKQPVRNGYRFAGWYLTSDYTVAYNFSNEVWGNLTLYAKWESIKSTVRFNANGGYIGSKSVKSSEKNVYYDGYYGALPEAKKKGYVFLGWYTKKAGGSKITAKTKVAVTKNTSYYAHFCKVKPKKAAIFSLKSEFAGKMAVRIKDSKIASGYQIRYSLKSSMKSAKNTKTTGLEKVVKGLKKGKTYYVQARMYQKESVGGKIYYGAWSGKKKVKIKKK